MTYSSDTPEASSLLRLGELVRAKRSLAIAHMDRVVNGDLRAARDQRIHDGLSGLTTEQYSVIHDLCVAAVDEGILAFLQLVGENPDFVRLPFDSGSNGGLDAVEASLEVGGGLPMDYWSWVAD